MKNKSYIKNFIDERYFEFPKNFLVSFFKSFQMGYTNHTTETILPFIYAVNKTCENDKYLVSRSIKSPFVFLKDDVIQKILLGELSKKEKENIVNCFKKFKETLISVVIFPEEKTSVFGDFEFIDKKVTDFIFELGFDIRFFTLINTVFASPVWSKNIRKCETRFNEQFTIKFADYKNHSKAEFNEKFNKYMPTSSATLTRRFNPKIRSKNRAENAEQVFYCCPNCEKFFTLYSEFNCLKCRECGSAVEFSFDGTIALSSKIANNEDFAEFQENALKRTKFKNEQILSYHNLQYLIPNKKDKLERLGDISATFFKDKVFLVKNDFERTYTLKSIQIVELLKNNILHIKTKDEDVFIQGTNKENFYFFIDLFELSQKKTSD